MTFHQRDFCDGKKWAGFWPRFVTVAEAQVSGQAIARTADRDMRMILAAFALEALGLTNLFELVVDLLESRDVVADLHGDDSDRASTREVLHGFGLELDGAGGIEGTHCVEKSGE